MLIPDGDRHFTLSCDVVISPQFFAWIFGFEGRAKILSPPPVREAMAAQLRRVEESLE